MWEQTKSKDMELRVLVCFDCIPVASEPMVHVFLRVYCVKFLICYIFYLQFHLLCMG